uniref:Uncharacterized protein n=1 Tax=Zooxanthella nutricula TaxID=1333877 RepID=A0A6U9FH65_9DINO|mmetsp:Transcript_17544/g.52407  ORF Transcript_17544/g.52407 Transcript_17544/m.52407 type:complete len:171 (+) Transcript_17544:123-635(+)|eukprot:CAMPEP_0198494700 /NCGR_PEP_ID=MMETSP1462-20131121/4772_1 /TAXON_ID=1333877 /ORGANISM="Brandtodinium nutriculum, Strain RCC3387" /LENGTH=170 /DNA_ID=CAMNT_0044223445 /DNA_START=101 /DNA_END=613 /DNA_ORIENTATION=+
MARSHAHPRAAITALVVVSGLASLRMQAFVGGPAPRLRAMASKRRRHEQREVEVSRQFFGGEPVTTTPPPPPPVDEDQLRVGAGLAVLVAGGVYARSAGLVGPAKAGLSAKAALAAKAGLGGTVVAGLAFGTGMPPPVQGVLILSVTVILVLLASAVVIGRGLVETIDDL